MLYFPIELEDDDGTVLATSPDFPELTTFGDDRDEALARAVGALEEAVAARACPFPPLGLDGRSGEDRGGASFLARACRQASSAVVSVFASGCPARPRR